MNYKIKNIIGACLLLINLVIIKIFFGGLHFDNLSKEIFEDLTSEFGINDNTINH